MVISFLFFFSEDCYQRKITVDGEEVTIDVLDTAYRVSNQFCQTCSKAFSFILLTNCTLNNGIRKSLAKFTQIEGSLPRIHPVNFMKMNDLSQFVTVSIVLLFISFVHLSCQCILHFGFSRTRHRSL